MTDTVGLHEPDRGPVSTPPWARMSLSWGKLAAIENWLQGPSARRSEYWWVEGQLALGEGRLQFAREDLENGRDGKPVRERLWAARQGFSVVKKNSRASSLQRRRATRGLSALDSLKTPTQASSTKNKLIRRSSWRARAARPREMTPSRNRFSRITVHHSADSITPQLDGSLASSGDALRRLQRVHMDGPKTGYGDMGYHFLIDPQGRLFEGRELAYQGAHAGNSTSNKENIGICLLGNFQDHGPSSAAMRTLENTLADLRGLYNISNRRVFGHMDFKNTLCPGEHLMAWVKRYSGR